MVNGPETCRRRVDTAPDPLCRWAVWLAWGAGLALVLAFEIPTQVELADEGPVWVTGQTLWVLLFGALPLVMLARRYVSSLGAALGWGLRGAARVLRHDGVYAVLVGAVAAALSVWANWGTWTWPPAYHDEFSYLFQAKTLLAGRLYYPSHPLPDFFDMFHVLNEGVFASRYYPGNALWMLPGLAVGCAHLMYVVAAGLIAVLTLRVGLAAGHPLGARVASALVALSPATQVFSTTLLSHHPCTVALLVFLWGLVRVFATGRVRDAALAGTGLGCAVLCRPPTALGVAAIPMVCVLVWLIRRGPSVRRRVGLGLGVPLGVCALVLLGYNAAITGDPFHTPHRLYNNVYTPRHRYGFHNVTHAQQQERAARARGTSAFPERDKHPHWVQFERWADDLTPSLAVQKLVMRLRASTQWAMACALAPVVVVLILAGTRRWTLAQGCVVGGIVGMHVAYFPFAFEGIFSTSYALETVPLWCLLGGIVVERLVASWQRRGAVHLVLWLALVLVCGVGENWIGLGQPALDQLRTIRSGYRQFDRMLADSGIVDRAIVFVHDDGRDIHLSFVYNDPDLRGPVLRAWSLGRDADQALKDRYPDRRCYLCRAVQHGAPRTRWMVRPY